MDLAFPTPAARALTIVGRALLGLYFVLPGITKITGWDGTVEYMAAHGVPLIGVLLPLTIALQIGGGALLMAQRLVAPTALVLAGLTLVISLFMHDFWTMAEGMERAHETQNFVKNLAIMAGLLVAAGTATPRSGT
jgi:putative oxidoreductase